MAKLIIENGYSFPMESKSREIANDIHNSLKSFLPHTSIEHVQYTNDHRISVIKASTHKRSNGMPETIPSNRHSSHSGVTITLYHNQSNKIQPEFTGMNSMKPGDGSKMVSSVIKALEPHKDSLDSIRVHHDHTQGFWHKMRDRHSKVIPWKPQLLVKPNE